MRDADFLLLLNNSSSNTLSSLLTDGRAAYESDKGIATVSGAVSQWNDQKNTNHLTQGTAGSRFVYVNDGSGPNGKPYLQGNTSGRFLTASGNSSLQPANLTTFCVARANTLTAAFRVLFQYTSSSAWTDGYGMNDPSVLNSFDAWVKAYNTGNVRATPSTAAWHVFESVYDGTNQTLYVDGTSIGSVTVASITYISGTLVVGAGISGAGPTFSYYWDGDVAALAIDGTTGGMTAGSRSKVRKYLGAKYGITVT